MDFVDGCRGLLPVAVRGVTVCAEGIHVGGMADDGLQHRKRNVRFHFRYHGVAELMHRNIRHAYFFLREHQAV